MFSSSFTSRKKNQKQITFTWTDNSAHSQSCPRAMSILLCSVIILSEEPLVQMDILQIITLAYYIDDVMLAVTDEQEVASVLDTLERHAYSRRRQNPERFSSLSHRQSV